MITAILLLAGLAQEPAALDWSDDLSASTARAERDGRPLLVVFR